jgi:SsrA-binding protein
MKESILAENKQANFNYEIIDKFKAGIKLTGPEVKAAKLGQINLRGSYATLDYGSQQRRPRLILKNCRINKYTKSGYAQIKYDPLRDRELLVTKKEINLLLGKMNTRGLTLIPFSVYTIRRLIKIELALVKGKTKLDKREQIKKRDIDRRLQRRLLN